MINKRQLPEVELVSPGHTACPGCGSTMAMRYALKALGPKTVVVIPACCWAVLDGTFPNTSLKVPLWHMIFESAASAASGIKAALEMQGDTETTVLAWAGDGGTFDIGLQALSGAAERNDDIIYVCYDNEAYMNTGIQRSSATPWGSWTTTTPAKTPKDRPKKNMMEIMAAHQIPYAATATVAYPEDMIEKMRKAASVRGMKFIHILSPCPTGWRIPSSMTVKIARLAVHTNVFPLYEIEDGARYTLTMDSKNLPVREYLKPQGRFAHLTEREIEIIQRNVDRAWETLLKKAMY